MAQGQVLKERRSVAQVCEALVGGGLEAYKREGIDYLQRFPHPTATEVKGPVRERRDLETCRLSPSGQPSEIDQAGHALLS